MTTPDGKGDCFVAAGKLQQQFADLGIDAVLCHGLVRSTDRVFWHAWVELGDTALDASNGGSVMMRIPAYYGAGQITDVHRYTFQEMCLHTLTTGHWGPWVEDPQPQEPA